MKLSDWMDELKFTKDEGLWAHTTEAETTILVSEVDDGIQVIKMPDDGEKPTVVVKYNRIDSTLYDLLKTWTENG